MPRKTLRGGMSTDRKRRRVAWLALVAAALIAAPAASASNTPHRFGDSYGGAADEIPPEIENVDIVENLGGEIPLGLPFRDEDDRPVTLGDFFEVGMPVIVTFNYSDCPMLCSVQLGGLVDALQRMDLRPGRQFRIVTVTLDPTESPELAGETKARYLERLEDGDEVAGGWHYLTGSQKSIERLAAAVGFQYEYSPERNEYFHPPAIVFASPSGTVSSYQYGVRYEPEDVTQGLMSAALGDTRESAEQFILSCFLFEGSGGHAYTAFQIMRIGGIGFVLLAGGFAAMYAVHRSRGQSRRPRPEQLRS
jgi:protein SCO1